MNVCLNRGSKCLAVERVACREAAKLFSAKPQQQSFRRLKVLAWGKKGSQQQVSQSVEAAKPSLLGTQPWFVTAGGAVLAVALALYVAKRARNKGSMGSLESRGLISEGEQTTRSNDPFYSKMMRNVNTVQYDELTQDQIEAARKRRSQDMRNNEKVDLSKIQLPANHPFAVSKELSEEEDQLQMARLKVRRGMPIKDMNQLKARQDGRRPQFDPSERAGGFSG